MGRGNRSAAELDGRTAFEIVSWVARETGRRVVYDSAAAEASSARDDVLGLDSAVPSGILTLLPHLPISTYEIRDDVIVVSAP